MDYRPLGNTGLTVSVLGFGCGSIGGLMVRGDYPTMRRTVARAIELGVNYFDTASMYGNGQSEVNLSAVLRELGASPFIGTKVWLAPVELDHIEEAVIRSVESSLRRLGRDSVGLIHFHNPIELKRGEREAAATIADLQSVLEAFQRLQRQGKIRYWGMTGLGATDSLQQAVDTCSLHSLQVCYNLLNPTAGTDAPPRFPFQDYRRLIDRAAEHRIGVIAIRILAGGALSGTAERHPVAAQAVAPIGTSRNFSADVQHAQGFHFLVQEGYCSSLVEAAIRFAISHPGVSTALVGVSSLEQLEQSVAYGERGALPAEALDRLPDVWAHFVSD